MSGKTKVIGDYQPFVYHTLPGREHGTSNPDSSFVSPLLGDHVGLEEQIRKRAQEAWERGVHEGESRARTEYESLLRQERERIAVALTEFGNAQQDYFRRVEGEVVQLALAIARKILHRETQLDPLLLVGVVRFALDKLGDSTTVRMRVHPAQVAVWREFFSRDEQKAPVPELIGDASLAPSACALETELGDTNLSLEAPLREIEQGFFDLLAQRPAVPSK